MLNMAAGETGISTEAQLAAAIEAEQWYEEDSDTEEGISDQEGPFNDFLTKVDWTECYWNTGDKLNSHPPPTINIDTLLRQLNILGSDTVDSDERDVQTNASSDGGDTKVVGEVTQNGEDLSEDGDVVSAAPSAPTPGPIERPKYYCIAQEIMTTERTYVQSLRLLEKVVHGAIKTAQLTRRPILPDQGRKEIFLNIGEIYALNFDLLQELEDRLKNWDSNPMIADIIAKRAPFFKLYSMYSARFDSAQVAYCKWLKASKLFADLIKLIETGPLCKGLPVSSYMLCPVQRVPRYKLLLEDYLRHLPEGHADIENTKAALAAIAEAADHMNDRISDLENQAKVVQMQKTFVGKESIVAPGRKYIGRGPVYFVPGSKRKQRVLFLFSDILLVAGITAAGRYKVHHKLPLKKMLISVVQSPVLRNAFCIAERGLPKPFRFCTKSAEERTQWIKELSKAKAKDEDVYVTLSKNSPYAKVLNDPEAHSSIMEVLNDPAFEHSHPSWVRRSLRLVPTPVRKGLPFSSFALASGQQSDESVESESVEEVDFGEEIVTEFLSDEDKTKSTKVLKCGQDNSLSCYMHHLSGTSWECRWFVLTSRTLVCYQSHLNDVAFGALSLVGYSVTTPQPGEFDQRKYVLKVCCPDKETHIFQLSTSYDFDRWFSTLQELLLVHDKFIHFST